MKDIIGDIKRLSSIRGVFTCRCVDSTVIRIPLPTKEGEYERSGDGPNAACSDIKNNDSTNKGTGIKAIENQRDANLDSPGDYETDDTHSVVVLKVINIMEMERASWLVTDQLPFRLVIPWLFVAVE